MAWKSRPIRRQCIEAREMILGLLLSRTPQRAGDSRTGAEVRGHRAALPGRQSGRKVHPVRPVRPRVQRHGQGARHQLCQPRRGASGRAALHGKDARVHRLRRVHHRLPHRRDRDRAGTGGDLRGKAAGPDLVHLRPVAASGAARAGD